VRALPRTNWYPFFVRDNVTTKEEHAMGCQIPCLTASIVVATLLSLAAARAQDDFDRTPEDCVRASSIRSTHIVDDQTILFHMRGNRVYRNQLPDDCPRLAAERRFTYERRVGQRVGRLCSVDSITVLESFRSIYGATCRLGKFYPITQTEVDDILGVSRAPVRIEEVELPEEDEPIEGVDAAIDGDSADE
jgi:hypothetical protein